jgi:hypothetical protein
MKTNTKLRIIYIILTCLCILMTGYTAMLNIYHDELSKVKDNPFLPKDGIRKFNGQTVAMMAHIMPSTFWSMCIPIQFHPSIRKSYPKFHKYLGRAFIYTSYILMVGVAAILHNGITFEHFVNEGPEAWTIVKIPGTRYSIVDLYIACIMAAFLYTAKVAVDYARQKDYYNHKIWIIRHCSWGVWIMTFRVLFFVTMPIFSYLYGHPDVAEPRSGRFQGWAFFGPITVSVAITVGTAEYAVSLMNEQMRKMKKLKK